MQEQRRHWERTYGEHPSMYGLSASEPGSYAIALFARLGLRSVLELGAGQGRDTIPMLEAGLDVIALDYAEEGLAEIRSRADRYGVQLSTIVHDVRQPLPFEDASFDACYSHMLFNMALTTTELVTLSHEVERVLRPGGVLIYTARHTGDAHYGTGVDHGDNRYENGGFIVHFLDRDLINRLAEGFRIDEVTEFVEGALPRKLFRVTMTRLPVS
ncbi:class I SAM-dependent methyltransferase [Ferrimicrobium sp.]|uniref:class I SAM-dependent methyltransferase n=1 Tax=Ferrimicrobium sp. TaxID=2926050 RepID=UPI002612D774|nr:class I SAM-dependent methyltransferase [Ferrimicrobium sp.]